MSISSEIESTRQTDGLDEVQRITEGYKNDGNSRRGYYLFQNVHYYYFLAPQ